MYYFHVSFVFVWYLVVWLFFCLLIYCATLVNLFIKWPSAKAPGSDSPASLLLCIVRAFWTQPINIIPSAMLKYSLSWRTQSFMLVGGCCAGVTFNSQMFWTCFCFPSFLKSISKVFIVLSSELLQLLATLLQILHWFVQMCLAVKHIHDKRVLHRDIKSKVNRASFVAINKLFCMQKLNLLFHNFLWLLSSVGFI